MSYIYVIYTREFLKHQEHVYKVGKTKNIMGRLRQYPRGSKLLFAQYVHDCDILENLVINYLSKIFKVRTEIGTEYFEGDVLEILKEVQTVLANHMCPFTIAYDEENNRLKKPSKPHVKRIGKKKSDDENEDEQDDE